jgi:uncharacterized protein YdeI (YjbR/CyaY-like superfamily)
MPKAPFTPDLPVKLFKSQDAWAKWLETNHAKSPGIWMRIAKKDGGLTSVNYAEALDVALCHGWIDGQKRPLDEASWLQRFTPRGARSMWSTINKGKAKTLIESGRMRPSGMAAIESAKADGRWDAAYGPSSTAEVPPELRAALDRSPKAKAFFETLRGANRYALIYRVHTAKKPETKAKRVADFIARLERGETIHQAAKKKRS